MLLSMPLLRLAAFAALSILAGCSAARLDAGLPGASLQLQPAPAQTPGTPRTPGATAPTSPPASPPADTRAAIAKGVELLLAMQESLGAPTPTPNPAPAPDPEGFAASEWPYEGVYKVGGKIPIGYRVGCTAICAVTLLKAPGYDGDKPRQEAVARALKFVAAARNHPLMSEQNYSGGYDVRCWGYIYAVRFLCALKTASAIPEGQAAEADLACRWYLSALHALEMPRTGGWNYARPEGRQTPGAPSPFMTAPALRALFEAAAAGYPVDGAVVARGLESLEKARAASGAFAYAGVADKRADLVPGATGRMLASESTLLLAGRSSVANVRAALDAFIVHWKWLEARRQQQGTHIPPYQIAPYYVMYAHAAAGEAIELLPKPERAEYRRRFNELLFSIRDEGGTWNDRVFKRSANYGTACALTAMMAPDQPAPAGWPTPAR